MRWLEVTGGLHTIVGAAYFEAAEKVFVGMSLLPSQSLLSSTADLPKQIAGYEVLDLIGTGAGSIIYAVSDAKTKQILALKYVERKTDRDIRFVHQLEAEYEVGRLVTSPLLRRSVALQVERTLFRRVTSAVLVLELFDGLPLDVDPPQSLLGLVEAFMQTAHALHALHEMGYVHCDLKPNNILINSANKVKVIDLGQACKIGTAKERIQGTPDYIAPEQVKLQPVSPQTDIFNLGATMYWSLTGQKLPTLYTIKKSDNSFLVDGTMASPRSINPSVPAALSDLVMQCVRTVAQKRPEGMMVVARRLETIGYALKRDQMVRGSSKKHG